MHKIEEEPPFRVPRPSPQEHSRDDDPLRGIVFSMIVVLPFWAALAVLVFRACQ